jgi:hypothetical protein
MKVTRALLAILMLAGCSQPASSGSADTAEARELRAVEPLKTQYKPVITGIEATGTTLNIFVDAELMSEMDGPVEQAMEDQALKRWRETWKAGNPGKHATLRVRFRNYYGEDVYGESAKV